MQGIDRVNHPTQMQTQTQASTQVIKKFSSSWASICVRFPHVWIGKSAIIVGHLGKILLLRLRISLSLHLRWTCELAHISICVCVCICIARENQSSEPSSEWHTYNYRADYVSNWKLAMFLIWWAVLSSFHKKMINKIKGRRFGTLLFSLVDKLRILLGGEKISWFSRSHVVREMPIYVFVA